MLPAAARRIAVLLAAAAIAAAAGGLYFGKIKPDAERAELMHQAALTAQEERNRKLRDEQERLQQKIADAERQIFEEQKKKAIAIATAKPTTGPGSRPGSGAALPRKTSCRPCSDPSSPLCDGNGCELNR